jgi:hypothetical protein
MDRETKICGARGSRVGIAGFRQPKVPGAGGGLPADRTPANVQPLEKTHPLMQILQ